jgi:kumamolisin
VDSQRFAIPGSENSHESGGSWLCTVADQRTSPTIFIRRPQLSRELLSADPGDLAAVRAFVRDNGLKILAENAEARTVRVEGTVVQVGKAFGVDIEWRIDEQGRKYLSYRGALTVPTELNGIVAAVLGLDQRPVARRGAAAQ